MGVTAATPANIVVGAGNLFVNGADVGATADDNTYRIEQEIFAPDNLNGVPGLLRGTHYKTREEAILEASMPEVSAETLALLWPGSSETGGVIDWDGTRRVADDQYNNLELQVPGLEDLFQFLADNALNMGNIEYNAQDAGMMTPRGEFHSTWLASALTTSPHRIIVGELGS